MSTEFRDFWSGFWI